MATTFCVICGTEVDEQATFCPACGNPMDAPPTSDIPAAPAWPRRRQAAQPQETDPAAAAAATEESAAEDEDEDEAVVIEPTAAYAAPPQAPAHLDTAQGESELDEADLDDAAPRHEYREAARPGPVVLPPVQAPSSGGSATSGSDAAAGASVHGDESRTGPQFDVPITWPVTLSGWLIGIGSFVGALAVLLDFRAFTNPVTLIAFLLLLAVAATVFFSANVPAIAHRQMWVVVIVLVAFGAAFERVGAGTYFAGLVFFLGTGAAAVGAIILELGMDRPLGGTGG
jgi:hypothetical protein